MSSSDAIRRVPHCSHWGAYTLLVRGSDIVGVEPFVHDPNPSPIINSVVGWIDLSKRIKQPLVREGWLRRREKSDGADRGRDRYVEVPWDKALELVAGELERVRTLAGNRSIFGGSYGWTSCGRFHHSQSQLRRLLNLIGGYTGHVDTYSIAAGPAILRHVLGSDASCAGGASTLDTVAEHADTLLVFGALTPRNAQNEAGGIGRHNLEVHQRRMKARGVRIFLVSPTSDDIPDWVEADWLPIRPNTDVALMLALAHELVSSGRHDRSFLSTYCSGADVFLDYLSGASDGIPKNAQWAEKITEIPAGRIVELAEKLAAGRSMISVSWALQRAHHGEQPFWAAIGLAATLGQIGLPGGGVGFGYASTGGIGAPQAQAHMPALPQGNKPIPDFIPVARIADMLLKPGTTFDYQGETHTYPEIKLVYWAGGNPFHHHQDINRLRKAWAVPQTVIVQDPVWTATAARADIVLPVATTLERNDLTATRRSSFVFAMHKAIEPIGSSRPDYEIFKGLSERLGVVSQFTLDRTEMQWVQALYEDCRRDVVDRLGQPMPDFESFWEAGWAEVPTRKEYTYLAGFRASPTREALKTESGRIVLGSERLAKLDYRDCRRHPAWIEPAEWLGSEDNAHAMFHLISRQPAGKLHSQLDWAKGSQDTKRDGRECAVINPEDAAILGIKDGEVVRLWNQRGQCLATASVSDKVRKRVVLLATGSYYRPGDGSENSLELAGNPNVLTLDIASSSYGQGCSAHTALVNIEPFDCHGSSPDPAGVTN